MDTILEKFRKKPKIFRGLSKSKRVFEDASSHPPTLPSSGEGQDAVTESHQVSLSQTRRPTLNVKTSPRPWDNPSTTVTGNGRPRSSTALTVPTHFTPTLSPKSSVRFINKKRSRGEISYHTAPRLTSVSPTRSIGSSVHFHPGLKHQSSWAFNDGSRALRPFSKRRRPSKASSYISQNSLKSIHPCSTHRLQLLPPVGLGVSTVTFPSPSPFPRHGFSVHANPTPSGEIFLFGGFYASEPRKDLYRISSRERSANLLQTAGDIPPARIGHASVLFNNSLFVWGGNTKRSKRYDSQDDALYMFDIGTRRWSRVEVTGLSPPGRYNHTMNLVDGKIFLFGGEDDGTFFGDVWTIDLDLLGSTAPSWTRCTLDSFLSPCPRSNHISFSWEGKTYIHGGKDSQRVLEDIWAFDHITSSWSKILCTGHYAKAREGHSAAVIDGTAYILGGRNPDDGFLPGFMALTLSTREWSSFEQVGSDLNIRHSHAMIPIGHKLLILGATSSTDVYRTVNILDTAYLNYTSFERPSSSLSMASSEASDISNMDMNPEIHLIGASHDEINEVSDDGDQSEPESTSNSAHVEPWFSPFISPLSNNSTASIKSTDRQADSASQVAESSVSPPVLPKNDAKGVSSNREKLTTLERPEISKNVHAIYANVVTLILDKLTLKGHDHVMIAPVADSLGNLTLKISGETTFQNVIHSRQYRIELMKLSSALGCHDTSEMRSALRQDEEDISTVLLDMIASDAIKNDILELQGEEAENMLSLIHNVIDQKGFSSDLDGQKQRQNAYKFLVKLSENCGILPPTLGIDGITDCGREPVNGGGFADIFRASFRGEEVALKRLRDFQVQQERKLVHRKFCKEALLWQSLRHPHILPFYGIDLEVFAPRLCMVSPWMQHGNILKHIVDMGGPKLAKLRRYLSEIAQGLRYLHTQNIIHGDLRGTNIFIDDQWHVRLADFGLAGFADATLATHTSTHAGSIRWMAPELHNPELFNMDGMRRTKASDVYSFACVVLELHTLNYPFSDISRDSTVIWKVMNGERPPRPVLETLDDFLWAVVEECWRQYPSHRPEMEVVVEKTIQLSSNEFF